MRIARAGSQCRATPVDKTTSLVGRGLVGLFTEDLGGTQRLDRELLRSLEAAFARYSELSRVYANRREPLTAAQAAELRRAADRVARLRVQFDMSAMKRATRTTTPSQSRFRFGTGARTRFYCSKRFTAESDLKLKTFIRCSVGSNASPAPNCTNHERKISSRLRQPIRWSSTETFCFSRNVSSLRECGQATRLRFRASR